MFHFRMIQANIPAHAAWNKNKLLVLLDSATTVTSVFARPSIGNSQNGANSITFCNKKAGMTLAPSKTETLVHCQRLNVPPCSPAANIQRVPLGAGHVTYGGFHRGCGRSDAKQRSCRTLNKTKKQ